MNVKIQEVDNGWLVICEGDQPRDLCYVASTHEELVKLVGQVTAPVTFVTIRD